LQTVLLELVELVSPVELVPLGDDEEVGVAVLVSELLVGTVVDWVLPVVSELLVVEELGGELLVAEVLVGELLLSDELVGVLLVAEEPVGELLDSEEVLGELLLSEELAGALLDSDELPGELLSEELVGEPLVEEDPLGELLACEELLELALVEPEDLVDEPCVDDPVPVDEPVFPVDAPDEPVLPLPPPSSAPLFVPLLLEQAAGSRTAPRTAERAGRAIRARRTLMGRRL
jgi:hypothetical protein